MVAALTLVVPPSRPLIVPHSLPSNAPPPAAIARHLHHPPAVAAVAAAAAAAAAAAGVELIVVNCQRKRHKKHPQQLTNGSTILFMFTFPINLDLFNLSTVSFTFHVCNFG